MKIVKRIVSAVSALAIAATVVGASAATSLEVSALSGYTNATLHFRINTASEEKHDFYLLGNKGSNRYNQSVAKVSESAGNHWWWGDGWKNYGWLFVGPTIAHTYVNVKAYSTYTDQTNQKLVWARNVGYKKYSDRGTEKVFHYDNAHKSDCTNMYVYCNGWGQVNGSYMDKCSTGVRAYYA